MEFLNRASAQLHELYRSMTPGSRLTAGVLAAVVLLSLGYLGTRQVSGPDADLMHGVPVAAAQLPLMEAAFAKANLTGYEIRGTSIRVPRGQESAYMAALAEAKALPPNFGAALNEAIAAGNPFASSRDREERMKIAKQDVLALIICSMPGIERAYVLYDESNKTGFNREKVTTATACVKPAGSSELDEVRASAIRDLVVGAYAGLRPECVTVSDLNNRTWRWSPEGAAGADGSAYLSLKRNCEQDLKAKILNALGYIPNVTVELSVELDRASAARVEREGAGLTPISARVSVGVPVGYFKKVWRERNPVAPGHAERIPDAVSLERIRIEETANIQRCVAPLLPPANGAASPADCVTVTIFQEIPAVAPPLPEFSQIALNWLAQSWSTLGLIGLALICVLVLRSMVRAQPAAAQASKTPLAEGPNDHATLAKPASAPPPHWRRHSPAAGPPLREELSALVEEDPETAANILRNWIGQVS